MFSIILPGRPCQPPPDPMGPLNNQFAFSFPSAPHFSHIVVFLLPSNAFPPDTAAGVHVQLPGQPNFRFLGALANEKQSAIFKVNLPPGAEGMGETRVGISVESVEAIRGQLEALEAEKAQQGGGAGRPGSAGGAGAGAGQPSTKVLAQRIIKNAFNFLASFSGTLGPGGQEVVPLKSFEEWWRKFERRVEVDPGFLEREDQA